ncbi:hypothetical protein ACN27E_02645 [Mycobacterium sp. WMMD1722]|uniref:hypothetical protein n=1 Tax=Mycobacterium sp. WMMD1722 TaxID=3404117 RepID=UPI003BF503B9
MLIIALVLAVIGLAALVTAVVTSNELIAWVCIGASLVGVVLLIVDAVRERSGRDGAESTPGGDPADPEQFDADYPEDAEPEPVSETETESETDSATVDSGSVADADRGVDAEDDTRAVPFDERHEDRNPS